MATDPFTSMIPSQFMDLCQVAGHACVDLGDGHVNAITDNLMQATPAGFVDLVRHRAGHPHVHIGTGRHWDRMFHMFSSGWGLFCPIKGLHHVDVLHCLCPKQIVSADDMVCHTLLEQRQRLPIACPVVWIGGVLD